MLLEQPFVKDDSKTVQQLLDEASAKLGEKVAVRRFVRYKLGEDAPERSRAGSEPDRGAGERGWPMTDGVDATQYSRVLLKLSGEAFAPADAGYGINTEATALVARQLAEVVDLGVQTAVVVGRRQHLAWPAGARASTATAPTTWACSPP